MIFVTVVLSFVIWLTQSLRFVDMVVNRGLPITDFLWLAMLITPRFITLILPFACVIATIYVYNRLIADRELIVLRAAGFSNLRLARPAIRLALVTALAAYVMNIYLLPVSFREFADLRYSINSDYSTMLLQEGSFNTLPSRITIFVRERRGAGVLNGILVHDGRDPDEPVTYMANEGRLVSTDSGPRLVLIDGNRQQFNRKDGSISFLQFEKQTIDVNLASGTIPARRKRKPEEMFMWELFDPGLRTDEFYGKIYERYRAEGHSRIVSPALSLGFVLMALAILLSGDFSRRGQNRRIFSAALLVVLFYSTSIAAFNLSSDNIGLIPVLYANVTLPILFGF
ncbi:MAG: LPS export ABC transporter permease LptF, partial [Alphaproteobacteria bacterium]|nr:LPS export ABC transporter permease LptF [Alphaproteobacteria bacterium]